MRALAGLEPRVGLKAGRSAATEQRQWLIGRGLINLVVLLEGLEGIDLSSAIETANRDFTRFQNQCQLFYAEVRKRAADADKLESDMARYPHYFQ